MLSKIALCISFINAKVFNKVHQTTKVMCIFMDGLLIELSFAEF